MGPGNNRVAVIDCWYMRFYSASKKAGKIKVKVTTITDEGVKEEFKIINITSSDWDNVTNTYYMRYQPKLQRGVGIQLTIESDFAIYDLQCSVIEDSTIQLTKKQGGKI